MEQMEPLIKSRTDLNKRASALASAAFISGRTVRVMTSKARSPEPPTDYVSIVPTRILDKLEADSKELQQAREELAQVRAQLDKVTSVAA